MSTVPVLQPILRVEGLIKIYGKRRVVDGVSFHVNHGEIVGLLGPNGAGKTTSFRMACGLIETNGGIVYLDGQDVTNWPMYRRSREGGMGYLPQAESVFRNLSVQDNLLGVMELLGIRRRVRRARCDELLEKFKLTHLRKNRGSGLSGGERRRLEIARALVSDPKIILLDEPFAAIDPITVHSIQEIVRQLAQEGISILVTDHKERETLQITQRSYVIREGQVLCHGTPEEVLANEEARQVYFGNDVSIPGNSTVYAGASEIATVPSPHAAREREKRDEESGLSDSSLRLPQVRSRPKPVEHRRTKASSVAANGPDSSFIPSAPRQSIYERETARRPTEALPERPIAKSDVPIGGSASAPDSRPTTVPRPSARPARKADNPVPDAPSETPAAPAPDSSSSLLKAVNTFLWGGKR